MSNSGDVPMMFRAAVTGRCQLQFIDQDRDGDSDIEKWVDEWIGEDSKRTPNLSKESLKNSMEVFQGKNYQIGWRFVSNSGADPSIILPVIAARGFPHYPGSSMKGAFRQACKQLYPDRVESYCGDYCRDRRDDLSPGILRFHGAYPISTDWTNNLIDLAHPQSGWQVKTLDTKTKPIGESAFVQVSLHKPELRFSISSAKPLGEMEWQEIWQVWEQALSNGIGCRVCAGYGKPKLKSKNALYSVRLDGQGAASKLLDDTPEFRPNMFRASIRGHALRLFGGLTDEITAESLVVQLFGGFVKDVPNNVLDHLFGGVSPKHGVWGLLNMDFRETKAFDWKPHGYYGMPHYTVEGELSWSGTRSLSQEKEKALKEVISWLMTFSMLLGGYGKGWRRVDHRRFYHDDKYEKLIGCHWEWQRCVFKSSDPDDQLKDIKKVINHVQKVMINWMKLWGITPNPAQPAKWREAWCHDRVQVWGRVAEYEKDSIAIRWLHEGYDKNMSERNPLPTKQLKRTPVAGFIGNKTNPTRIGRLWHRMYPVISKPKNQGELPQIMGKFLELITFFPDTRDRFSKDFNEYLTSDRNKDFIRLW